MLGIEADIVIAVAGDAFLNGGNRQLAPVTDDALAATQAGGEGGAHAATPFSDRLPARRAA